MKNRKFGESPTCVRLSPEMQAAFIKKAHPFGGTSEVLRQLIAAFVEDRLPVLPPSLKGTIYHVD